MNSAAQPQMGARGPALLKRHCDAVAHVTADRASAIHRLEDRIGFDLAHMLVGALAGDHRPHSVRLVA